MIEFINNYYFELKNKYTLERQIWLITGTKPFSDIINMNYEKFKNVLILEHSYFYPVSFHQNNLNLDINNFHINFS